MGRDVGCCASERRRLRVRAHAAARRIEAPHAAHVVVVEPEVEHGDVLLQALRPHGFGDDDQAAVEMPADHHLRRRLAVLGGDAGDDGIGEKGGAPERAPGFRLDSEFVVVGAQGLLLEARVELDLVDRGREAGLADDPLQMLAVEVGDADRADPAFALQADQRLPGLDIKVDPRPRPVDEIEVDPLAPEPFGALVEGAQRLVEAVIRIAELGRDEHVRPVLQRLADALLVAIHRGGVDEAIAVGDRLPHDLGRRLGRGLEDAEPELRHRDAVVEGDDRLLRHGALLGSFRV